MVRLSMNSWGADPCGAFSARRSTNLLSVTFASPVRIPEGLVARPVDSAASDASAAAYVPLSERTWTAEEIEEHHQWIKRSSSGINDWNCVPADGKRPVVLVHGLMANKVNNWIYMGPRLQAAVYCVYSLTYGTLPGIYSVAGLDKIENSAAQLLAFIDQVLAATNATQVDLVGHSQGSLMPRYYLKFLGGAAKVNKFAAFGPIAYGTTLSGIVPFLTSIGLFDPVKKILDPVCKSCFQFIQGSDFLNNLNAGGDTVPGVQYQFIASKYDEVVTPYTNGFLRDKNPAVKNIVLQDLCSLDHSEHALQMFDPIVFHKINAFLSPSAPQTVNCLSALS
ncbi:alpha/beta-hydrolase [Linnemannia elongata AG-77]|uniref:Alpha/beta-hydrolase n=1 Tax=Linnemannia elongata AG-77 TaxID=1314771 RepID=A0A197KBK7_9FUNG|nr:alpha/beta-hydrolase [Linnemannia elongata AG-77]